MRRRHSPKEIALLARQLKLVKEWISPSGGPKWYLNAVSRKRHPLDCGKPRCSVCHSQYRDPRDAERDREFRREREQYI